MDSSAIALDEVISGNRLLATAHQLGIPYCKTDYLDGSNMTRSVFVTHNGGYNIRNGPRGSLAITTPQNRHNDARAWFLYLPPGVMWFAQNADAWHNNLRALPLGLDNWEVPPEAAGREHDYPLPPDGSDASARVLERIGQTLPKTGRVYLNLATDTAPYERGYCYAALHVQPWVTTDTGRRSTSDFMDQLMRHEFCACPEGNGIDTHRVWEALYLGCYPIVVRSTAMERVLGDYRQTDLPILWVEPSHGGECYQRWDDLDESCLDHHLACVERGEFSLDRLKLSYWREQLCQALA